MKIAALALAAAGLASVAVAAQTAPTTAAPGARPEPAVSHSVATTPTKAGGGKTVTSTTTARGAPATHTAASLECSKQADAQGLHGKARKKMRSACKDAAKKG